MAPKAAAPPPPPALDFPAAVGAITSHDPQTALTGLNALMAADATKFPQDVDETANLVRIIVAHVLTPSPPVSSAALKLLTKCYSMAGPVADCFTRQPVVEALWGVFADFHQKFGDYSVALSAMRTEAAESVASTKAKDKAAAAKVVVPVQDPEANLPGPSKHALDTCMTWLNTMVFKDAEVAELIGWWGAEPWIAMLRHHSCRIQMRALRLLRVLLRSSVLAQDLLEANGLDQVLVLLASSGFGAVKYEAMVTLMHLLDMSDAAVQLAVEQHLPDTLLQLIMEPTTGVAQRPPEPLPEAPPPEAAALTPRTPPPPATPRAPPPRIDYSKPAVCTPAGLQETAAQLLLQLCKSHHGAVEQVVRLGGLQLLMALLPSPVLPELPPPPTPQEGGRGRASGVEGTIFANLIAARSGGSKPTTPEVAGASAQELQAVQMLRQVWGPWIEGAPAYALPAAKLESPELQALLLATLACLLSEPGVQQVLWDAHSAKRPHLQLLYLLAGEPAQPAVDAAPPPPAAPAAPPAGKAGKGAAAAAPPPAAPPARDPLKPPFPASVQAMALQCMLQLCKHGEWRRLAPYCAGLQAVVGREPDGWTPDMVAPLAALLQLLLESRLPPVGRGAPPAADTTPAGCNWRANGLSAEENGLAAEALSNADICSALKHMAHVARKAGDDAAMACVARALLVLPEDDLHAPPWPPLPSPPPTPPPPPLPTSQFTWMALGKPFMSDGIVLEHV